MHLEAKKKGKKVDVALLILGIVVRSMYISLTQHTRVKGFNLSSSLSSFSMDRRMAAYLLGFHTGGETL